LKKTLETLKDHYIVCGYGRMGKVICNELKAKGIPFVVVEKEEELQACQMNLLTVTPNIFQFQRR
jgi:voltage-gated potassium channel